MTNGIKLKLEGVRAALLKPINRAAVGIVGTYNLIWGLWILMPWSVYDVSTHYRAMSFIPEAFWALTSIALGVFIILSVINASTDYLIRASMTGYIYWFFLTALYLVGNWNGTAWITALMISLYYAFIALNLKVNRSKVEQAIEEYRLDDQEVNRKNLRFKNGNDIL